MATACEASAEVKPYQEMSGNEAAIKAIYKRRTRGVNIPIRDSSENYHYSEYTDHSDSSTDKD
jgi:hypothetical protein